MATFWACKIPSRVFFVTVITSEYWFTHILNTPNAQAQWPGALRKLKIF